MSRISFVVAVSRNGVIGRAGGLPWHISSDLRRFKAITMGKPLIMGRKTWESLPKKPLPGRQNIVITRQKNYRAEGAIVVNDTASALTVAREAEEIAVIGGGEIFAKCCEGGWNRGAVAFALLAERPAPESINTEQ